MAAERPLGTVMRTTGDQFRLDLDFDKWKISQLQERGPLIAKPVNRDGDLAESCLLGEVARRREIAADFATVNLENESFESRMIGQLATQKFKSRRIVEKRDRQVDRQIEGALFAQEKPPICDCLGNDELRQSRQKLLPHLRHETGGRYNSQQRVAHVPTAGGACE